MAKNRIQNGKRISVTLGATITSGTPLRIGDMLGVALKDGVSGDVVEFAISEVYDLPVLSTDTIVQGDKMTFDASAEGGTVTNGAPVAASGDVADFGIAWEAHAAGAGNVACLLVPGEGTGTV